MTVNNNEVIPGLNSTPLCSWYPAGKINSTILGEADIMDPSISDVVLLIDDRKHHAFHVYEVFKHELRVSSKI